MPDSEADATYERNVKEQYETLGRFVEAFELMVNAVRRVCIDLLPHDGNHDHLIEIVFHHQVMTAKPLFEIMRATIADLLKNVSHRAHGDRDFFNDLLSFVQKGYDDLVNKRNNLLHGTWIIGTRSGRDPDASQFYLFKYTTTKHGLEMLKLPRTTTELRELTKRCDETRAWIENIGVSLDPIRTGVKITELFEKRERGWALVDDRAGNTAFRRT
jgi:hypothetical protein